MQGGGRLTADERQAYKLGRVGFQQGDVDLALSNFEKLLQTRPAFADVHYMMGVLLEGAGDYEGAVSRLRTALRLNPSYAEAMLALASVYEQGGDYDRASALTERVHALSRSADRRVDATTQGKLANLQATLADAYREAGETREAIDAYRKALDRCPDFHDIRYRMAVAMRDGGLTHMAIENFRRVLRARPDFLDAAVQLGVSYYTLGRTEEAIEQWLAALARDASRDDARMYLRMVQRDEAV